MRNALLALLALCAVAALSGCERADYQHPLHRSADR